MFFHLKPLLVEHPWGGLIVIGVNALLTICILAYIIMRDTNLIFKKRK